MKEYVQCVATFDDFGEAQKLAARLCAAGVAARIHDEAKLELFWFLSKPRAATHVEVPEPCFHQAVRLIEHWETTEGPLKHLVRCPQCHSSRVEYPALTRKFLLPVLIGHVLAALGITPRSYYCHDCHFTWPAVPKPEAPSQPLWPLSSKPWRSKNSGSHH